MVVCGACRSTITKDADAARATGHMAAVVEDGSLVQIGTRGRKGVRTFNVVGRLRMQYDEGEWNEWYVLFDDGTDGWLSDASGQYAVMPRNDDPRLMAPLPAYDELQVGQAIKINGQLLTVSDRRESRCIGGEGELPIDAADGWDSRAADLRGGNAFATIDYSDAQPVIYSGSATERTEFTPGTLRRKEDIEAATGRYRGKTVPLDCPNCGGAITIVAAMATQVVCPSCSSLLDCSGDRTEIIEANKRVALFKTTVPLGTKGRIDGAEYQVIGIMRCEVPHDSSEPKWTEYLLLNPERGYLWLVETEDGWSKVKVCDEWPTKITDASVVYNGRGWPKQYEYGAKVEAVFGAFNWRVRKGDTVNVTDYQGPNRTLTREQSPEEITFSLAEPMHVSTIASGFKMPELAANAKSRAFASSMRASEKDELSDADHFSPLSVATYATIILFVVSASLTWGAIVLGLIAVWTPLLIMWNSGGDDL